MPRKGPAPRRIASTVLLVLGSVVLLAGDLALYADREVLDSEQFADNAVRALDDDAVRDAAAREIARVVVGEVEQDLVAFQALIEPLAAGIIDTEVFRTVFREAVAQGHSAALGGDRQGIAVTVANVGVLVQGVLERVAPKVARQIPEGLDTRLVEVSDGGTATDLAKVADRVRAAAYVLPALAILLLGLAIAFAAERRRAITRVGIAITAVGAAVVIADVAARSLVLARVDDQLDRDAVTGIWSAFLGPLRDWNLALAAVGAVIAGAGAAVLEPVDAIGRARALWDRVRATPASRGWRAARALVLIGIGVLMVLEPSFVLGAVTVVAGLVVISIGVGELIRMVTPPASTEAAVSGRRLRLGVAIGVAVGSVAAVIGVAALALSPDEPNPGTPGACNGTIELCDRPLDEVVFPATHNSMSAADYPGYLFPMHDRTIPRQLDDGIRGLLIDSYYGLPGNRVYTDFSQIPNKLIEDARKEMGKEFVAAADRVRRDIARPQGEDPRLYLCHGFCELGAISLDETLDEIRAFLERNTGEVLLVNIEDYVAPKDMVAAFERAGLDGFAYSGQLGPEFPTLGELVDSGKRLIVLAENRSGGAPWYRSTYDFFQETPFSFSKPDQMNCDPNRGAGSNPLFLINHWINTDPAALPSNAAIVNARGFLSDRVELCQQERGLIANLIAVDFYRQGDLLGVSRQLNGAG